LGSGRWSWSRSWVGISLIKSGGLEREGGRDTRAAFTRAIQVLETDDGGRDASLLVLDGVSKREIDLDRRVVERMTELRIAGQGLYAVRLRPPSKIYPLTLMKSSLRGGQGQGTLAILPLRFGPSQSPNSVDTCFRNETGRN
jgi:hypothetical protein